MRKAWESWSKTEDFKNAVKWALATRYEDGRRIKNTERIEHIKGAMWRAFLKGIDYQHIGPASLWVAKNNAAFVVQVDYAASDQVDFTPLDSRHGEESSMAIGDFLYMFQPLPGCDV